MTLFQKRLLTLFSVALNIGFVIMATVMILNHPPSRHERTAREVIEIVERLDLPAAKEEAIVEEISRFRETMNDHDHDLKTARRDVIRLLAAQGPVDRGELHRLFVVTLDREKQKSGAFEAHVMELRSQLGDEKGAQFFSQLLAHIEARGDAAKR